MTRARLLKQYPFRSACAAQILTKGQDHGLLTPKKMKNPLVKTKKTALTKISKSNSEELVVKTQIRSFMRAIIIDSLHSSMTLADPDRMFFSPRQATF